MKKMIVAGAVLLLASSAQLSSAKNQKIEQEEVQQIQQKSHRDLALSGYIGMASFDSEEKPDPYQRGVTHEMESDDALKFGIILSKYYNDFSFNLGIEFMQEVEVHDEKDNLLAEHSHIPISLGVNYHFNTSIVNPYIGAGIGYSFNDSTVSDFISAQGMSIEMDDSMFYYLTAGIEYPVNDSYAIFLAGQYTIADADMTGSGQTPQGATVEIEDEGTLDRYEVNVGVKYFF
ncbi:Outer membrane protein W [Candidatus Electrothrix communis]|uniref:Outer membrane protein W n=1 Tax=Candidatus Electrothrix communis TaxID=1859133 RepID=A0A3S3RVX7_9BACT|nr:Outer membrane protein W [Candidatus Electrothrix communis]WLE97062.1 MAG: OmpW family outer membrane protein [Candidatus Electrothrix communis]